MFLQAVDHVRVSQYLELTQRPGAEAPALAVHCQGVSEAHAEYILGSQLYIYRNRPTTSHSL